MHMDTADILKKVRQIEIQTGKLVEETFAGQYLSAFKGQGIEFSEVREYTPGDDIRSIDWNVTARSGVPYVKKFNEERELTLMIACDVSASQRFGSVDKFKQEAAAELAALFAFCALKNSDKVGLLLFSDQVELFVPPKKGKKHILRLIRELVAFEPKGTGTDIPLALNTLNKLLKRQGILIFISDFLTDPQTFASPLRLAAKKFDFIPVLIQDKLEKVLPKLHACISLRDPESGVEKYVSLANPHLHRMLGWQRQAWQEQLQDLFRPLKISAIEIDPAQPTADPVIAFFRQRARKEHL